MTVRKQETRTKKSSHMRLYFSCRGETRVCDRDNTSVLIDHNVFWNTIPIFDLQQQNCASLLTISFCWQSEHFHDQFQLVSNAWTHSQEVLCRLVWFFLVWMWAREKKIVKTRVVRLACNTHTCVCMDSCANHTVKGISKQTDSKPDSIAFQVSFKWGRFCSGR